MSDTPDETNEPGDDALAALEAFLDRVEASGSERMIVRWVDESRPVPAEEGSGFAVRRVTRVTITAKLDGEAVQETFEGVTRPQVAVAVGTRPLDVHYISDNLNR